MSDRLFAEVHPVLVPARLMVAVCKDPCFPLHYTTRRYIYLPLPMPRARHMTGVLAFQVFRPGN